MKTNVVYKGDCLKVMPKRIKDKSIDLIVCDLPYGTTRCKWDTPLNLDKLWEEYERVIKDNGAILLFAQSPFDKVLGCSNLKLYKYEWIWEKTTSTGYLNSHKAPLKAHENILVFYKKQPTFNPQKIPGHVRVSINNHLKRKRVNSAVYNNVSELPSYNSSERFPNSILVFPSDKQKVKLIETQKPLALIEYLIRTYSNKGDVILDNTAGSGTTGRAALNTGRKYILIEKNKENYEKACERVRDFML